MEGSTLSSDTRTGGIGCSFYAARLRAPNRHGGPRGDNIVGIVGCLTSTERVTRITWGPSMALELRRYNRRYRPALRRSSNARSSAAARRASVRGLLATPDH